ncbi:SNF2 family N-terminal domain-containing protein [Sanguibacter gelidistatuariae]|uniref:SNF2 family N-terminal domain-containing protein n=1 Tax=Sanguibacter gelidistatuariae TaxID=1814289 RepID=A0A1G6T181_9MICO|nr:helicase-related protein [Sanguibacter gelidistatuariae]SDD22733.1 SNF2 family N-terminal domain-containing protein [Sanguibacter gelidistatuariae]
MTTREAPELALGSMVRLVARPEITGAVVAVDTVGARTRYSVFRDGAVHQYFVEQIEEVEKVGRAVVSAAELHAGLTARLLLDENSDYLHSRNSGRVDFEPYQYRPVLKLVQSDRPRILVADDVGVGKTIEACLILKELQARKKAESVLVICPRPLVVDDKWRSELKRFDEDFVHLDSKALRFCLEETLREGVWPARYNKSILPYSLLDETLLTGTRAGSKRKFPCLDDVAGDLHFDLVIVDEAHHIRNPATKAYENVQRFVDAADAVVMLSATPIQTHNKDLFTLVSLLRDDLVIDWDDYSAMLEPNKHLYEASVAARSASDGWQRGVATALDKALGTTWGREVMTLDSRIVAVREALESDTEDARSRIRVVRHLEALNSFSDIVTRTRRRDIGEFTTRKPSAPEVDFTEAQQQVYAAVIDLGERIAATANPGMPVKFLMSMLYRQAASSITGIAPLIEDLFENRLHADEMPDDDDFALTADQVEAFRAEARAVQQMAGQLVGGPDPKADVLRQIIEDKSAETNNKVLVFTTFRHTIEYLESRCREWGIRVAVMHGGVPDHERKEVRRRFKLDRSDSLAIDVMLCSEVGTEGLDYQFCNTLVNYDIPWNPMRIEQRIGRIDRRGQQSETVAIINILTRGTIEAEIYWRCLSRIGVFNHALGGSEQILGELASAVVDIATNLAMSPAERSAALRQFSDNQIARIEEEEGLEDQQAELLGYAGRGFEEKLAEASSNWLESAKIADLVRRYFDMLQPGRSIALRPGRVARVPLSADVTSKIIDDLDAQAVDAHRLKRVLRRDKVVLALTTDPDLADEGDDVELLGPMHPLVRAAARASELSSPVDASLRVTSADVEPGNYAVGIYAWTRLGVRDALTFRFVSDNERIEERAAELLSLASDGAAQVTVDADRADVLDRRHAELWAEERERHHARHLGSVERRIAALETQKARRLDHIQRQQDAATHGVIAAMKAGESRAAESSFDRMLSAQIQAAGRVDITAQHLATIHLEVLAP